VQSSPMHASAHATVQGRQAPVPRQISRAKSEAETAEGRALVGERNETCVARGNVVSLFRMGGWVCKGGGRAGREMSASTRTHAHMPSGGWGAEAYRSGEEAGLWAHSALAPQEPKHQDSLLFSRNSLRFARLTLESGVKLCQTQESTTTTALTAPNKRFYSS
jgi:hypothetical protein